MRPVSLPFLVYSRSTQPLTFAAPSAQSFNPPVRRCGAQESLDFPERLVPQQLGVRQDVFDRVATSLRHTTINFLLSSGNSVALFWLLLSNNRTSVLDLYLTPMVRLQNASDSPAAVNA